MALVLLLDAAVLGAGSGPQDRFKARADLVAVDVSVTDSAGRPVRDLAASDFVVEEDGVQRSIESFEALGETEARQPEPWLASRVASNTGERAGATRTLVVLLDDLHLSELGAARARAAAAALLERLPPGSRAGVAATSGAPWLSGRAGRDSAPLRTALAGISGRRLPELRGADQITDFEAERIARHNDSVVLQRVAERWTRNTRGWEQTWGADTAPAGSASASGTDSGLRRGGGVGDIRSALGSASSESQTVLALATQAYEQARERRRRSYQAILRALAALGAGEGRRSVLFVSERFLGDAAEPELALVAAASRRADAPVHVLDVSGLGSGELQANARRIEDAGPALDEQQELRAALARIANDCGGLAVIGTDDIAGGVERLLGADRYQYRLGYPPASGASDGTFRRIQVAVRRPGVQVRARQGYVAAPASDASAASPGLREAADAPFPLPGIGLRVSALTFDVGRDGATRALLVAELRLDDVRFEAKDGQLSTELDVLLSVSHFATGRTLGDRPVGVKLASRSDPRGQNAWHRITQEVQLLPGDWLVRAVVRDRHSGALGSVSQALEVPAPRGFRASSAVISDVLAADATPEAQRALPLARRTFAAAGLLYCELEVYDASRDRSSGAPRVTMGFALARSGGGIERRRAPVPLEPAADQKLRHVLAVPLRGLKPGDYELVVELKDLVSGSTRELREPLSLVRAVHPTAALYRDLAQDYADGRAEDALGTLVRWPASVGAGFARGIDASEGPVARAAAMLHTEAALALLASREPREAPAHLEIARALLQRTEPGSGFRRDWLLAVGFQLQARGDRAPEALRFFEECKAAFPRAAEAWLAAGTVYEWSAFPGGHGGSFGGDRLAGTGPDLAEKAKRHYREALALDASLSEARVRLGRTLQRAGEAEPALAELARAADEAVSAPLRALARLFLGELEAERGHDQEAAVQYELAIAADPGLQQAGLALAALRARQGDRPGALEALQAAARRGCPAGPPSWTTYHLGGGVRAAAALDTLRAAVRS
jgi:VWFA-related protein